MGGSADFGVCGVTDAAGNYYFVAQSASPVVYMSDVPVFVSSGFPFQMASLVVKLDPAGDFVWIRCFTAGKSVYADACAEGPDGGLAVAGKYSGGQLYLDGVQLPAPSNDSANGFVVLLDDQGKYQWSQFVAGTEIDSVEAAVRGVSGDIVVAGVTSSDSLQFGLGEIVFPAGLNHGFLAVYSADGTNLWAKTLPDIDIGSPQALAADDDGNIYLAVELQEYGADLGDGPLPNGEHDPLVAKWAPDGDLLWARSMDGASNNHATPRSVVVDAAGSVFVAGDFKGFLHIGQVELHVWVWKSSGGFVAGFGQ